MIAPLKIQVRFSDLDILGHVNNVTYLSYFEMARVYYFKELVGTKWDWQRKGVVLVKNEVEYHIPILLYDEPIITLYMRALGNKSFTLSYKIEVKGKIYTTGSSTLVCFDSTTQSSIEIPIEMRDAFNKIEKDEI
jgi:acyl-CoA thioester hydrolase